MSQRFQYRSSNCCDDSLPVQRRAFEEERIRSEEFFRKRATLRLRDFTLTIGTVGLQTNHRNDKSPLIVGVLPR